MNRISEVGDDPNLPRADLAPVPSIDELRAENKELHLRLARLQGQVNTSVPLAVLKRWAEGQIYMREPLLASMTRDVAERAKGNILTYREIVRRCDGEGWPIWVELDSPAAPDPGDDAE